MRKITTILLTALTLTFCLSGCGNSAELEALKTSVAEKDATIADLNNQINELNATIEDLQKQLETFSYRQGKIDGYTVDTTTDYSGSLSSEGDDSKYINVTKSPAEEAYQHQLETCKELLAKGWLNQEEYEIALEDAKRTLELRKAEEAQSIENHLPYTDANGRRWHWDPAYNAWMPTDFDHSQYRVDDGSETGWNTKIEDIDWDKLGY